MFAKLCYLSIGGLEVVSDEDKAGFVWRESGLRPDYGNPKFIAEMRRQLDALYGRVPEEEWVFEVDVDGWVG